MPVEQAVWEVDAAGGGDVVARVGVEAGGLAGGAGVGGVASGAVWVGGPLAGGGWRRAGLAGGGLVGARGTCRLGRLAGGGSSTLRSRRCR